MPIPEKMKERLLEQFEKDLEEAKNCPMEFGALEDILIESNRRLSKLYAQMLVEHTAQKADFPPQNCPKCGGKVKMMKRRKSRMVQTTLGEISFLRDRFSCLRCRKVFSPTDLALGAPEGAKKSWRLKEKAVFAGLLGSYEQAEMALEKLAGLSVSSSEIDRLCQEHGQRAKEKQDAEDQAWLAPIDPLRETPEPEEAPEKMVLEGDATCVVTVPGEENKSVYCGTAFSLDSRGKNNDRPFIANRSYTACAQGIDNFGPRLKAMAWKGGMRKAEEIAFLGDGARCLWKWAEENLPSNTVFIQDFWHVCEHLSELAQSLGGNWEEKYKEWRAKLKAGKVREIIDELEEKRKTRRGAARKALDQELTYLQAGQDRMDYPRYKKQGWPIGSGAIEATCKHLVKGRFNLTGAQWRRKNIPQMLALRETLFNNQWDQLWQKQKAA